MTLDELAIKHRTDKSSLDHHYTRWYAPLIDSMGGPEAIKTVLEIGVAEGALW